MTVEESEALVNKFNKELVEQLVSWQDANQQKLNSEGFAKSYSENVRKALGGNMSKDQLQSRVMREIYKYLRMNLRNIVQYEFAF